MNGRLADDLDKGAKESRRPRSSNSPNLYLSAALVASFPT